MNIDFSKYQGTGNDFILLNNLDGRYDGLSINQIDFLCNRRFGVGADGLIKINHSNIANYEVDYYNSDGSKSFCGNGARCAVAFASTLGFDAGNVTFDAFDGLHQAVFNGFEVGLGMSDVLRIDKKDDASAGSVLNAQMASDMDDRDMDAIARGIGGEYKYAEADAALAADRAAAKLAEESEAENAAAEPPVEPPVEPAAE